MRALVAAAFLVSATMPSTTSAQVRTPEERDAYFESCRQDFVSRGMGNDDAAVAYCYEKSYGNDSGGGAPPPDTCYSKTEPCTGPVRPN